MKNIGNWILDWTAYLMLPIVYYTLRIAKAPFFWIPIESHSEWSMSDKLLTSDLMVFIVIVVLGGLWIFIGLWWLLYGALTLLGLLLLAAAFFRVRRWYRNKPSFWSFSKKNKI